MEDKIKLNLGCGYDIRNGWINHDMVKSKGVDVIYDLNNYKWIWEDNTFDEINAEAIFEHVQNPKRFIDELYRISKNGCKIHIVTEHFSAWSAWGDITHVRPFNSTSLDHVRTNRKQHNLLDKNDVTFIVKPYLKTSVGILNYFINLHNATRCLYERSFFKFIIPIKNLIFDLEAIKTKQSIKETNQGAKKIRWQKK